MRAREKQATGLRHFPAPLLAHALRVLQGAPLGAGTPKKFDSASKLANSLAFDSHSSPANPSLQIVSTGGLAG